MADPLLKVTDRSGTVTSGGTAQDIMAANAKRRGWSVFNASDITLYVNDMGAAATAANGYALAPGALLESGPDERSVSGLAISLLGATTGKAFVAREW